MPNIKQKSENFILSRTGEAITASVTGAVLFTLIAMTVGAAAEFVSATLYPFSYPFIHAPLHTFIPRIALSPPLPATLIFAAGLTLGIYYFEKNIFYRRFHLALKAGFAAVAACVIVFLSSLLSILADIAELGFLSSLFYSAEVTELPALYVYYYLASFPLFFICGQIRRKIYALP